MKTSFKVKIDGKENILTQAYVSPAGLQYNTIGNTEAHTFNTSLANLPKNKEIKINGCTYVILD